MQRVLAVGTLMVLVVVSFLCGRCWPGSICSSIALGAYKYLVQFVALVYGSRCRNVFITILDYCFGHPNPIFQILYLVILGVTYYIVINTSFKYVPGYYLGEMHKYTSMLAVGAGLLLFLLTSFSDPGTVDIDNVSFYLSVYPYDNVIYFQRDCSTCKNPKPARSKHCGICGRCFARFDHHCFWMNNCIGEKNIRYFMAFLLWHTFLCLYGVIVLVLILAGQLEELKLMHSLTAYYGVKNSFFTLFPHIVKWLLISYSTQLLLVVFLSVISLLLAVFFGYHAHLCLTNTTTNETVKWHNYIRRKEKLNEAKTSAVAWKTNIHSVDRKIGENKWRTLFCKYSPQNQELIKNNVYDRGVISNLLEIVSPSSPMSSSYHEKSS